MGTFTVISAAAVIPSYIAGGSSGTTDSCAPYTAFDYSTPGMFHRILNMGQGVGASGNRIIASYSGNPYKFLNIISLSVEDYPSGTPVADVGKLYLSGVEVTSFPMTPIDIEGLAPGTDLALELVHHGSPACVVDEGYRIEILFTITDIYGNTGTNATYAVQSVYQL